MRKFKCLIKKEMLQIIRDPSAILIAFLLPIIFLFIFGYGVNLDTNTLNIGVIVEDYSEEANSFVATMRHSKFLNVTISTERPSLYEDLTGGRLNGIVVIPQNFSAQILKGETAKVQVITDGASPNTASFVSSYTQSLIYNWWMQYTAEKSKTQVGGSVRLIDHYLYNQDLKSRNVFVPGSIAIIMTLIGTLLTVLVIAREWERGTMEAMMATPITIREILWGKLIPYYCLGIGSMIMSWSVATFLYDVPFRGSFIALLITTSIFLWVALGQGLLISSTAKNQFTASQIAIMSAFLPAFMLSGFIFEISSMPLPIQGLTYIFAARYYVTILETLFLTGDVWKLLLQCSLAMMVIGSVFFIIVQFKLKKRIDG